MPLLKQYYSFYSYETIFDDFTTVQTEVLNIDGWDATIQQQIYSDTTYGMDNVPQLLNWVEAALEYNDTLDNTKTVYNAIFNYYVALGIPITDPDMVHIVGPDSSLFLEIKDLQLELMDSPQFAQCYLDSVLD